MSFIGIDFGARKAGTTAICCLQGDCLQVLQSGKGDDADRFIREQLKMIGPQQVFIDAPLSLPAAYFMRGSDYMFRQCDRELSAMSPMFLGGLTARAIQLKAEHSACDFIEVYPKALAGKLQVKSYKHQPIVWSDLEAHLPYSLETPSSLHAYDAVLAWLSGYRYLNGEALIYGRPEEGQIIV